MTITERKHFDETAVRELVAAGFDPNYIVVPVPGRLLVKFGIVDRAKVRASEIFVQLRSPFASSAMLLRPDKPDAPLAQVSFLLDPRTQALLDASHEIDLKISRDR